MADHINISDMVPGALIIEGNYILIHAEVNCDYCMVRGLLGDNTGTIPFIQNLNLGTKINGAWRDIDSRIYCKHHIIFEPKTIIHIRGIVVKVNGSNTLLVETIQKGSKYVEYRRTC